MCAFLAIFALSNSILMQSLQSLGPVPIDSGALSFIVGKYKSPKDKISYMVGKGEIIRLKKGLYVASSKILGQTLNKELIANHIYGPSYISLESALAYYGLIPERVYLTKSITLKRSKEFKNELGVFEYITVPDNYYPIGITQEKVAEKYNYLIATPEKAICDMIVTTPGLQVRTMKSMLQYLENDLRIDREDWEKLNPTIIAECIASGCKKVELTQLFNLLTK